MDKKIKAARGAAQTYKTIRERLPKTWWGTVIAALLGAATGAVMLLSGCAAPLMASGLLTGPKLPALNVQGRGEASMRAELEANQASEIQLRERRVRSELRIRQWENEAEAAARALAGGASAAASVGAGTCPTCPTCPTSDCSSASAAAAASAAGAAPTVNVQQLPVDHATNALCEGLDKSCGPSWQCHARMYEAGATSGSIYNVAANYWFVPTDKKTPEGRPIWQRLIDRRHFPACSDEALEPWASEPE